MAQVRLTYRFEINPEDYEIENPSEMEYVAMAEASFGLGELINWEVNI